MEWVQFVIFFIGVFGLFIWNRAEARADNRHMDNKLEAQRNLILAVHSETAALIKDLNEKWMLETKDFHGRLVAIEERKSPKSIK